MTFRRLTDLPLAGKRVDLEQGHQGRVVRGVGQHRAQLGEAQVRVWRDRDTGHDIERGSDRGEMA